MNNHYVNGARDSPIVLEYMRRLKKSGPKAYDEARDLLSEPEQEGVVQEIIDSLVNKAMVPFREMRRVSNEDLLRRITI